MPVTSIRRCIGISRRRNESSGSRSTTRWIWSAFRWPVKPQPRCSTRCGGWFIGWHLLLSRLWRGTSCCTCCWQALRCITPLRLREPERAARALAVVAYPLSGPVLFLYCNPPFLVGAAWIPLALAGGYRLLRRVRLGDLAITAVGLAMPILGGDPQISLHVMLIGCTAAAAQVVGSAITLVALDPALGIRPGRRAVIVAKSSLTKAVRVFGALGAAVLLAALLTCPQLAASLDWARQSVRYSPLSAQHADNIYAFSVAPWHWIELALPAASGRLFPIYTRISNLIADDGKTWAITLYAGLIPLALTLTRYRRMRWRRLDLWDSLAPVGLAMALGSFGLGYALATIVPAGVLRWDDAAGGPYWWLVTFVPGYSGFRYPAKWLVFVPLGIVIAAARQASCLTARRRRQLAHAGFAIAALATGIAAATAVGLYLAADRAPEFLEISDSFWGPLQWQVAAHELSVSALAVTAIAAAAFWICRRRLSQRVTSCCLVTLLAVDLLIVAWPLVATVSRSAEAEQLAAASGADATTRQNRVNRAADLASGRRAMRFVRHHPWPPDWRDLPSRGHERMLAVEASQRNTKYGRWNLMEDQAVFNPVTSLPPHRTQSFWRAANGLSRQIDAPQQPTYWDRVLGWLAIDESWEVVVAADPTSHRTSDRTKPASEQLLSLRIMPVRSPSQRVLWLPQWRVIKEQTWVSPKMFADRLREITSDTQAAPPVVEVPQPAAGRLESLGATRGPATDLAAAVPSANAPVEVDRASPGHWKIRVDSSTSGLLCIKQFQDGNWRATVSSLDSGSGPVNGVNSRTAVPVPVYRCDYLFSAVEIPAGNSEVILSYRPRWLLPALLLGGLAWAAVLALLFWPRRAMVRPTALR